MSKVINFLDRKGKKYIGNIQNFHTVDANLYLLCSTYSANVPDGTIPADQLAPSFSLLLKKKAWVEQETIYTRFNEFRELYLEELRTREDSIKAFDMIRKHIRNGKDIVLFDNCKMGRYCHLNVLSEELQRQGFKVLNIDAANYKKLGGI